MYFVYQNPLRERPTYTRTNQVRGARPMIWPVLRAMKTPAATSGTHLAHSEGQVIHLSRVN
jgi:hypothetical protein